MIEHRQHLLISCIVLLAKFTVCHAGEPFFEAVFEKHLAGHYGWERYFEVFDEYSDVRGTCDWITAKLRTTSLIEEIDELEYLDKAIELAGSGEKPYASDEILQLFKGLKNHIESCDMETFRIMRRCNNAVRDKSAVYSYNPTSYPSLITMFNRLFRRHALNCAKFYLEQFEAQFINATDDWDFAIAKYFLQELRPTMYMPSLTRNASSETFAAWQLRLNLLNGQTGRSIYRVISFVLQTLSDLKYLNPQVREGKISGEKIYEEDTLKLIYKERVLKPCETYIGLVGKLFIPAGFDVDVLGTKFRLEGRRISRGYTTLDKFHDSLVLYRDCVRLVVEPDEALSPLLSYAKDQ